MWTASEALDHINCLELKRLCLLCNHYARTKIIFHLQLQSDNSTTVACINNNGSIKPACNDIARDIWLWCLERHNFVSAVHIPRSTNTEAGFESREIDMRLNNGLTFPLSIVGDKITIRLHITTRVSSS